MSCSSCFKKFGLFRSEHGCPGCGFSYCNSCLSDRILVKKLNKVTKVCRKCKMADDMPADVAGPSVPEPPKAYLRRIESLEHPDRPPITVYKNNDRMQRLKRGLSETDREIADRLERLREDRKVENVPSENEIRERLARLKDLPVASCTTSNIPAVDLRTDQQKSDDLLTQYMEEFQIEESKGNVDEEIRERLNKLANLPPGTTNVPDLTTDEDLTDEELAKRLLEKILAEGELEDKRDAEELMTSDDGSVDSKMSEDDSIDSKTSEDSKK